MNNDTLETWKAVVGYEGLYSVSSLGRIRCEIARNRYPVGLIRNGEPNADGYLRISLTKDCKRKKWFVHQLVAIAFIGVIPDKHEVNHINGIKTDNYVSNLEIVTHQRNMQHAQDNGLWNPVIGRGENHPKAKLDCERVRAIRQEYASGGVSQPMLAKKYGVTHTLIGMVVRYEVWKQCD